MTRWSRSAKRREKWTAASTRGRKTTAETDPALRKLDLASFVAAEEEREAYAKRIEADPADFIAQPTLDLSTVPALAPSGVGSRHVDLRPYCLVGREMRLVPGGLTRVALREGSLVVNSSQGGGVKDTWVLSE